MFEKLLITLGLKKKPVSPPPTPRHTNAMLRGSAPRATAGSDVGMDAYNIPLMATLACNHTRASDCGGGSSGQSSGSSYSLGDSRSCSSSSSDCGSSSSSDSGSCGCD